MLLHVHFVIRNKGIQTSPTGKATNAPVFICKKLDDPDFEKDGPKADKIRVLMAKNIACVINANQERWPVCGKTL